jgi:hypothetical protein
VVDVAPLGRDVAAGALAVPVGDLHGAAGGAGEAAGPAQVEDAGWPVEHDALDHRVVE